MSRPHPSAKTLGGTTGPDTLIGASGADVLLGRQGDDVLKGLGGGDSLVGAAGNDTLDGGASIDTMAGGTGDDIYIVSDPTDAVSELADAGKDLVKSFASHYTLPGYVENLILVGTAGNGDGNALDNRITGNASPNALDGGAGADTVLGGGGNDTIIASAGGDVLTGGGGDDVFVFRLGSGVAQIQDFHPGSDELSFDVYQAFPGLIPKGDWLAGDARFYAAPGATEAHDATDRLIYDTNSGNLYYDADGSGGTASILVAKLAGAPALTATDINAFTSYTHPVTGPT